MATQRWPGRYRGAAGLPKVAIFPEGTTQSFKAGDFVAFTSGKLTQGVSAGSDVDTDTDVVGMALADASGTADTDIPVLVVDEGVEFLMPVTHGTAASAVTAATQVGTGAGPYTLERTSAGNWSVSIDSTTKGCFLITEISKEYAVGEQYGWVWGRFVSAGSEWLE